MTVSNTIQTSRTTNLAPQRSPDILTEPRDDLAHPKDDSERSYLETWFLSRLLLSMQLNEILAINLRKTRQKLELTQEALAERAGLSARYIGAIERASVSASINVLEQLADALGV